MQKVFTVHLVVLGRAVQVLEQMYITLPALQFQANLLLIKCSFVLMPFGLLLVCLRCNTLMFSICLKNTMHAIAVLCTLILRI